MGDGTEETLAGNQVTLRDQETPVETATSALGRGDVVGRYVILAELGRGGMGVVYSAYDPELDRKVALKLLRTSPGSSKGGERTRLMREAQAMAQLNHPNVATVHDVGSHAGSVFIAMEFVEGRTLTDWLVREQRNREQILAIFRDAGVGLAAAHSKGLIHRDFKPDNVMVGDDGRVRVMDFGLARPVGDGDSVSGPVRELEGLETSVSNRALSEQLTHVGALLGTPRYMAPEQWLAEPADARSDQFAFCIALWEALYREPPFSAESPAALALVVTEGRIKEPSSRGAVPGWLRRTLQRGLASNADERWPSMDALLEALGRDPTRQRRRIGALVVVGVAAGAVFGVQRIQHNRGMEACAATGEEIEAHWNGEVAATLGAHLTQGQPEYAQVVAQRVTDQLDNFATGWRSVRTESCVAGTVDGTLDATTLARARDCHAEQLDALQAAIDVIGSSAGDVAARHAIPALSALPAPSSCADERALARRMEPVADTSDPDRVAALRQTSWRASMLFLVERYEEALEVATGAQEEAEALGLERLRAEAALRVGEIQWEAKPREAREQLVEAYFAASAAQLDGLAADAAIKIARLDARNPDEKSEIVHWARLADTAMRRSDEDTPLRRAAYIDALALHHKEVGDYPAAAAKFDEALTLRRAELGDAHPDVAMNARNVGTMYGAGGRYREALEKLEQALEVWVTAMGDDHPGVTQFLDAIGNTQWFLGDYDQAMATFERALEVRMASVGPEHPGVAASHASLGHVHWARGEMKKAEESYAKALAINEKAYGKDSFEVSGDLISLGSAIVGSDRQREAAELFERARRIIEETRGPDHEQLGQVLENLAAVRSKLGEDDVAEKHARRALEIFTKSLDPEHPYRARAELTVGSHDLRHGKHDEAIARFERARSIWTGKQGPDHPDIARAEIKIAHAHRTAGRPEEGLASAENAVRIRETGAATPSERGQARIELARILATTGGDLERARALARAAVTDFREEGDSEAERLADAEAWLERNG